MITCYAFGMVPPFAQGLVRDVRVRWALEEAGLPYHVKIIGDGDGEVPADRYKSIHPFGQVPAIEDGTLTLFESGAIVMHIAEQGGDLMPSDPAERAHAIQWMFAALNTIEVGIQQLAEIDLFYPDEAWAKARRPGVVAFVQARLATLARSLTGREYLVGRFSAADILMTTVLRILRHTDLVETEPVLKAYKERCEARPAFVKALADHMAAFVR